MTALVIVCADCGDTIPAGTLCDECAEAAEQGYPGTHVTIEWQFSRGATAVLFGVLAVLAAACVAGLAWMWP